jgi:lipid II:glycine glycyltransferase (peptidoglycan interpeptide bridge formation enzyme)
MITSENGFILLAEHDGLVIGASIFLKCGHTLHYKYNASDPAKIHSLSPNHLLTWNAIKWGHENNFTTFDFGRTSPDNKGLMRYKEMWGVTVADVPYYYYPKVKGAASVKEKTVLFRMYTGAWRLLPDYIAEKLSKVVFKHLA